MGWACNQVGVAFEKEQPQEGTSMKPREKPSREPQHPYPDVRSAPGTLSTGSRQSVAEYQKTWGLRRQLTWQVQDPGQPLPQTLHVAPWDLQGHVV